MPDRIVTETGGLEFVESCPVRECNLGPAEVGRFLGELQDYLEMFKPAFQRVEQRIHSLAYLRGCHPAWLVEDYDTSAHLQLPCP